MSSSYSHNIVLRMRDCLERQVAWFHSLKDELSVLPELLKSEDDHDDDALSVLTDKVEGFGKRSRVLEEEFHALKREWDASESISPGERDEIRTLGKEAQALSVELSTLYTRNNELAQEYAASKRAELSTMQRLSASLHKYRTDDDEGMSSFDTEA